MMKVRVSVGGDRRQRSPVRSFPGVKALLELGALVAEVEALLADGVVTVEADEHDAPGRVDALPGLREGGEKWEDLRNEASVLFFQAKNNKGSHPGAAEAAQPM